jgi:ribosome-binding factor A
MSHHRIERVNELLKRAIAGQLLQWPTELDVTAITITHVNCSPDLRHARVMVSVRADSLEKQEALFNKVRYKRKQIQDAINRNTKLKYTPLLDFRLDHSIEKGDHVLSIISQLESQGLMETQDDAADNETP